MTKKLFPDRFLHVILTALNVLKFKQTRDLESSDPDSESINVSEDSVASFEDDFDVERGRRR